MANGDRDPSSVLARLKRGLFMTHTELLAKVGGAIRATFEADPAALDALEEGLLAADVGPATAEELVAAVKAEAGRRDAAEQDVVRRVLKAEVEKRLSIRGPDLAPGSPHVILLVGVNGTGKTTTAAKLAARAVAASLAAVVVLPVPFTPTRRITWGDPGARSGPRIESRFSTSALRTRLTTSCSAASRRPASAFTAATSSSAVAGPTSAARRPSSSASSAAGSASNVARIAPPTFARSSVWVMKSPRFRRARTEDGSRSPFAIDLRD